jgi:signal peptidase I
MEKKLKANLAEANKGKWIRFFLWTVITILFSIWTSSGWWLLCIPFFFDIYLSRLLPWGFWKNSKNKTFKSIMDWVDAIVFALAAVYVINIYFFQNYQIPSSSLEKSLLVGDFLFVSKVSYGPRVPNTPLAFPLAHHTLPILNIKSYSDKPLWGYKRVPGLSKIKRNDIVVFNFPAGDTVALSYQMTDYYSLCNLIAKESNVTPEIASAFIRSQPATYGKVVYRPVDRREHYVKRCIGLPGETLEIRDNVVYVDGKKVEDQPGVQYHYFIQTTGGILTDQQFRTWKISKEDQESVDPNNEIIAQLPFRKNADGKLNPIYRIPATKEVIGEIRKNPSIQTVVLEPDLIGNYNIGGATYPPTLSNTWRRDHYGPIWIPKRGKTLRLTTGNLPIYERVIRNYEGNKLETKAGKIFINGKATDVYTFKMDYYWMMGDNRHNSADSRVWGFVPEDHIVGKPICVWLSLDKDRGWFDGKIRWNRFFKKAY